MKNALDIFWTLAPLALGGLWIVTDCRRPPSRVHVRRNGAGVGFRGSGSIEFCGKATAMTIENIQRARALAQRLAHAADDVLKNCTYEYETLDKRKHKGLSTGKQTAALRRLSMDLTRALAEMRKP